jgi:hypothetical protein
MRQDNRIGRMDRIKELMPPHFSHFNPVDLAVPVIPSRFFVVPVAPSWLITFPLHLSAFV